MAPAPDYDNAVPADLLVRNARLVDREGLVDLAVAFDFTSQYSFPTTAGRDYQGEAPEPGAAI